MKRRHTQHERNTRHWKEVPNSDGRYYLNRDGELYSVLRGRILKRQFSGTISYRIRRGNGYENVAVARLVAQLFLGPLPKGHRLAFKDHDSENVRLSNLIYLPTLKYRRKLNRRLRR